MKSHSLARPGLALSVQVLSRSLFFSPLGFFPSAIQGRSLLPCLLCTNIPIHLILCTSGDNALLDCEWALNLSLLFRVNTVI